MNERLKELAEQAGIYYRTTSDEFCEADKDGVPLEMMERFAELVRQDERERIKQEYNPYEIGKRLQKEGYGISDIGIRVKCDADIEQALQGYCDQIKVQA
jgi:hypothetical protein